MFLRAAIRRKDGKGHRCWSVVQNKRVISGRVVQRLSERSIPRRNSRDGTFSFIGIGGSRPRRSASDGCRGGEAWLPGLALLDL